jgi:hypothetical protein
MAIIPLEEQIHQKLEAVEADYFSKLEIAIQVKRDLRTLDRWLAAGIGPPATLISGRRYYHKKQFLKWLTDRERKPELARPVRRAAAKGAGR